MSQKRKAKRVAIVGSKGGGCIVSITELSSLLSTQGSTRLVTIINMRIPT
ncbi:hypothetical protein O9992_18065 [Vibrio lentus]|nr:hypothetical protein [Vibrio lentus]